VTRTARSRRTRSAHPRWRDLDPGSFVRAADSATRGVPLGREKADRRYRGGLLHPDETVILDVGTTTLEMAKAISPDLSLSVITSSLLIASELDRKPKVRTIVTAESFEVAR